MLSHVTLGSADFDRDLAFWQPLMARLGWRQRFVERARPWAAWEPASGGRPLVILAAPWNGEAATPGNGTMLALLAPDRAAVDAVHALALAAGGRDEGGPGLRPDYHPDYWGAYFRDLSGNKIALACHAPP